MSNDGTMLFVLATLIGGEQVISEFEKLKGIRRMSADVFGGRKALPVWRVVEGEHPESGEPVTMRTRRFISGRQIADMAVVVPTVEDHGYEPDNFELRERPVNLGHGTYTAPFGDDCPEGATPGAIYPVHRDSAYASRYVILDWDEDEDEQVRHWLDGAPNRSGHSEDFTTEDYSESAEQVEAESDDEWGEDEEAAPTTGVEVDPEGPEGDV